MNTYSEISTRLAKLLNNETDSEVERFEIAKEVFEGKLWQEEGFYSNKADFQKYGGWTWISFLSAVFRRSGTWYNHMNRILAHSEGKNWVMQYGVSGATKLLTCTPEQVKALVMTYSIRGCYAKDAMSKLYSEIVATPKPRKKAPKRIKVVEMAPRERTDYEERIKALEAENAFLKEELEAKSSKLHEVQSFFGKWGNPDSMTMDRVLGMTN